MMYISVLPLAISIRRTNVYEEQALGIYLDGEKVDEPESNETTDDQKSSPKKMNFISTHLRKQLSFDLWFIFLGLFVICICEKKKLTKGDPNFGIFQILFEIVSAYGTVGLSLGYPGVDTSFCSQFTVVSKLVIIAMMIRGRHRGLPYSIDRAIMLNTDNVNHRDAIQMNQTLGRAQTMQSFRSNYDGVDSYYGDNQNNGAGAEANDNNGVSPIV
ncbi:unnamed protein product [Ambrosiozyma monospora]|uniref:Unnamed protein product n=1 Tax=Ambrosiozyma monospora TaxID=43982 RepID=A0ACB5TZI6_AMBMO|nr:unnamed protein product [Ambrosiozyma monospora]